MFKLKLKTFLATVLGALFVGLFILGSLTGCGSTTEKVATRIGVQYAVGKYIERQAPERRVEKARAVLVAVEALSALAGNDETTVATLRAYLSTRLEHLSPADRLAAESLVELAAAALADRVGDGVMSGDAVLVVRDVLAWVSEAAYAYVPPTG